MLVPNEKQDCRDSTCRRSSAIPGAIAEFALTAILQLHDPRAPLVLVGSKLATANVAA